MWRVDGISLVLCHLDLERLLALRFLMKLSFVYCVKLADLSPLQHVKHLRTLLFSSCPKVADLTPLIECRKLEELTFSTAGRALDLKPLARAAGRSSMSGCSSPSTCQRRRPPTACGLPVARAAPADAHARERARRVAAPRRAVQPLARERRWHGPKEQGIERDSSGAWSWGLTTTIDKSERVACGVSSERMW